MTTLRDVYVTGVHLACGLCGAEAHITSTPRACLVAMGAGWIDTHIDPHLNAVDVTEDGEESTYVHASTDKEND